MTTKHASCESVAKNSPRPEIRKKMVACGSSFVLLLCTLMVDGYVEPQKCTPNGKPRCKDGLVCTPESGTWTWESTQPLVPIQWLCRQPKHSVWGTTLGLKERARQNAIDVSRAGITGVVPDLSALSRIKDCNLSENPMLEAGPLWNWLESFQHLRSLKLGNTNRIGKMDNLNWGAFSETLEVLELNDNHFDEGVLPGTFKCLTKLRLLNLERTKRVGNLASYLQSNPTSFSTVRELKLGGNDGFDAGKGLSQLDVRAKRIVDNTKMCKKTNLESGAHLKPHNAVWSTTSPTSALICPPSTQIYSSNEREHVEYRQTMHDKVEKPTRGRACGNIVELQQGFFHIGMNEKTGISSAWNNTLIARGRTWDLPAAPGAKEGYGKGAAGVANEVLSGDWVGFNAWFHGNYGHFLHDHLPLIAWMRAVLPTPTRFLIIDRPLHRKIMAQVDSDFVKARVRWLAYGETVQVAGKLSIVHTNKASCLVPARKQISVQALQEWIFQRTPDHKVDTIVYYSRGGEGGGVRHGRVVDAAHEADILAMIRDAMNHHGRKERLVVYNGRNPENIAERVDVQYQAELFRSAAAVIGPHGSGLANIVWTMASNPAACENRVAVLEFLCGIESTQVQKGGCPYGKTYYKLFSTAPWINYHHVVYAANSTRDVTYIDLTQLRSALDAMFSKPQKFLNKKGEGRKERTEKFVTKLQQPPDGRNRRHSNAARRQVQREA